MKTKKIIARAPADLSQHQPPSRYIVEPKRDGFVVRGRPHHWDTPEAPNWLIELCYDGGRERREPVTVTLEPYCMKVASSGERNVSFGLFGFFEFFHMLTEIAMRLLVPWTRPVQEYEGPDGDWERHQWPPSWLHSWVVKQTEKSINRQVHGEWQRLLQMVDPMVLAVHKKVFAATWNCRRAPLLSDDALYKEAYVVKDILSYPAAAVAVLASDVHGPVNESCIDKMRHWRDLFAPAGMGAYTTLNKTLMNLPGGVPASLLCDLRNVVLPRPVHNRLELVTTILAGARTADNFHVFAHATAAEIKEAIRRVSVSLQRQEESHFAEMMRQCPDLGPEDAVVSVPLSPRRARDVRKAVYYLLDFPEDHHGRLVGLAEKAIRWHGTAGREQEARKTIKRFGTERKLALPPIALPDIPGIRPLATVGDAVAEGERMRHCIASYSEKAVEGRCFLFHVDYRGESASVEVNHLGQIMQARGPRNISNVATQWGARVLAEWGRGFGDNNAVNAVPLAPENMDTMNELRGVRDVQPIANVEYIADGDFLRELMAL